MKVFFFLANKLNRYLFPGVALQLTGFLILMIQPAQAQPSPGLVFVENIGQFPVASSFTQ